MKKRKIVIGVLLVLLMGIVMFWPTPLLIRGPGQLVSLEKAVLVNQQPDDNQGVFYVTVVQTRSATLWEMAGTLNDPFRQIVNQETANNGLPTEASRLLQRNAMNTSQNVAQKVALDLAGQEASLTYQGVFVLTAAKESGLQKQLTAGDQVLAIDNQKLAHSSDILRYLQAISVGDEVTLSVLTSKGEGELKGTVSLNESTGLHSLGVQFLDRTVLTSDVPIEVELGAVGGPSAGLMFTLQMYAMIADHDLRAGRDIAGTGAISLDGQVTRVGGIAEKVYSSAKAGATAFLVPDDEISAEFKASFPGVKSNYQEAVEASEKLQTEMEIVPVKTVQDAVDWLEK